MMLDVLIPIPVQNIDLLGGCIEALKESTDFDHRVVAIVDGGSDVDIQKIQKEMSELSVRWTLLNNSKPVYLNQSLREGIEECVAKITAVVSPQVRLEDKSWFAKGQSVFNADPRAFVIDTEPNTKSATSHPIRRAFQRLPNPGCAFALLRTGFVKSFRPFGTVDPIQYWAKAACVNGGSSWFHPGIRYSITNHEDHATCYERSEPVNPFV
jgi:hypothetical protein